MSAEWAWIIAVTMAALVVVALVASGRRPKAEPGEVRRLVAEGAALVDVRSPAEFASGHLPGAVNVPVGEIAARASELGPLDRPIVVYCRSGARSGAAANVLSRRGFAVVVDLGAMSRW